MAEKLNSIALGAAASLTFAIIIIFLGTLAYFTNQGNEIIEIISTLYIGYEPTVQGITIGAIWALIDGFIIGIIFGLIHNKTLELLETKIYPKIDEE